MSQHPIIGSCLVCYHGLDMTLSVLRALMPENRDSKFPSWYGHRHSNSFSDDTAIEFIDRLKMEDFGFL